MKLPTTIRTSEIILILAALVALIAAGCARPTAVKPTVPSTPRPSETPTEEATTAPTETPSSEELPEGVKAAQRALSDEEDLPMEETEVVDYERVEWPNACLGLAEEGEVCAQVITPGWRVEISADETTYVLRTDLEGSMVRRERGSESDSNGGTDGGNEMETPAETTAAISPTSGPPGTEVALSASGFPSQTIVELGVGPLDSEYSVLTTTSTGDNGTVKTSLPIPADARPGQAWVAVVAVQDGEQEATSNVFHVVDRQVAPAVQLSPASGSSGSRVRVSVVGFPPRERIDIGVGRVNSEFDVVTTAETDAQGHLETTLELPQYVDPSDKWVVVAATENNRIKAVSEQLVVAKREDGEDDLFGRTQIFLIALEDAGDRGREIGCGDSLVPVEIDIEPTVAPMTAAYERLFALESEFYGQSGLYNALHRSTLELTGIDRAQLEQIALQYETVTSVSIQINGLALEEALAQ